MEQNGARRFLLLNDANVAAAANMALRVGTVTKHPENPLFVEENPWERRFDNLYGNIVFDPHRGLYQCWYSPFIVAHSAHGMTLPQRLSSPFEGHAEQEMGVCYAQSRDGITWEKPNLGLVEYEGSERNNLVMRGVHGSGIFRDDSEEDASRRYKALFQGLRVSFSPDGIDWSMPQKINCQLAGDTHNNAMWVPQLKKYVAFTRDWIKTDRELVGAESKTNHGWCRRVARIESSDFVNWSEPTVVIDAQCWEEQPYAMTVFPHGDAYLGLLVIHDQISDRAWTELAYSEDTLTWQRIDAGNALIGCSDTELDYDYGCVYACAGPVFLDEEVRLYYGGSDWLHFGWRNGCLALATLRADGFAGYSQVKQDQPGVLRTSLLDYGGEEIQLTADVMPQGSIVVKLLDQKDQVIAENSVNGSTTDGVVLPASSLAITPEMSRVRLEFTVVSAQLFSFVLVGQ
ncbi:MAG TPA: hypothetical protein DEF77_04490 [Gammaproteobacteria bacterium]|nr:hypothetical protein [Gammaproteobacteria bacterium]|tara:strand:- start:73 stop:1446 length:1374 start_codon:yes stop_codon:yes gene_type:complete